MLPDLRTRPAVLGDAGAIARIYNQGIDDRTATFETAVQTQASVAARLEALSPTHPAVVVERDQEVVGFAWCSPYRPRACYAGIAEFSVYIERSWRGRGCGRLVLIALIDEAEGRGFLKLVSRIFPENVGSRRLCSTVGFREVGIYRRHAKLDGRWRDCLIVERLLGEAARGS